MKKLAFILSFIFVASLGMVTSASVSTLDISTEIAVVDLVDNMDECKKGCTCEKCDAKTAEATKNGTKAEAKECCKKGEKKECSKEKKKEDKK